MHWCLGMYASGSTWLFNAAAKVAAAVKPDIPVVTRYVTCATDLQSMRLDQHNVLIKTHDTDDAAAAALRDSAGVVLTSVRDPRDCVTSLMLYQRYRFSLALATVEGSARACIPLAADKRTTLLRYEDGFIDDPRTLDRLAAGFGSTLASRDRSLIFLETRRSAIERQISRLSSSRNAIRNEASGDLVDPVTQWHSHHSGRSGEVGRWRRMLSPGEAATIEDRLADWMVTFGYPAEFASYARPVGSEIMRL